MHNDPRKFQFDDKPIEYELTDELRAKLVEEVALSMKDRVKSDLKEAMTEAEAKINENVSKVAFTDDQKADLRAKILEEAKDAIRLEMKEFQPKPDRDRFQFRHGLGGLRCDGRQGNQEGSRAFG